jgi:hypothetical protein
LLKINEIIKTIQQESAIGREIECKNDVKRDLEVAMKYEQITLLEDKKFRRLTGIKRTTFDKMIAILQEADLKKKREEAGRISLC